MNEKYLERESDAPENWVSNIIMRRDGRCKVFEVAVPDDEEVTEDAGDN